MNWKRFGVACVVIGLLGQLYAQWGFGELMQFSPHPAYGILQFTSDIALRASALVGLGTAALIGSYREEA